MRRWREEIEELEEEPSWTDHKCWGCEWGRFESDRFFCLFIKGSCAKTKTILKSASKEKSDE